MLWLLLGCTGPLDDTGIVELFPEIDVDPEQVEFGEQGVPTRTTRELTFTNEGRADLEATLELVGEGAAAYQLSEREVILGPKDGDEFQQATVELTFAPTTYLDYTAELVVTSNDEDRPEIRIPVTGTGISAPLPDIYLDQGTLDFGEVGTYTEKILWLGNAGRADLHVGDLTISGSGAFSIISNPSRSVIAAGQRYPMVVGYEPDGEGHSATIRIPSDDPDEENIQAVLLGNGGGDFEYPVAVIACPAQIDPPRLVSLDGYASYDPNGLMPLTYAWTLTRVPTNPAGAPISSASLSSFAGPTTVLTTDAVGVYEVELQVTNAIDTVSAPTSCVIEAIPDEELVVELTWDTPNADIDLHLALADNDLFDAPGDASWCNPSPDWSAAGHNDDPERNLDDRAGFGPENIAIRTPADGAYDVRIHYYDDHGDGAVVATVRVYVRSSLAPVFEQSRLLDRDDVWYAARINWPAGTVGDPSQALYTAPTRQCF